MHRSICTNVLAPLAIVAMTGSVVTAQTVIDGEAGCLDLGGSWDVATSTCTVGALDVAAGDTLNVAWDCTCALAEGAVASNAGEIYVDGTFTIAATATLNNNDEGEVLIGGSLVNWGTLNNNTVQWPMSRIRNFGTLTNAGTFNNYGDYEVGFEHAVTENTGEINHHCPGWFRRDGTFTGNPVQVHMCRNMMLYWDQECWQLAGRWDMNGRCTVDAEWLLVEPNDWFEIGNGFELITEGTFLNAGFIMGGGTLGATGAGSTVINVGTLQFFGGGIEVSLEGRFENHGTVENLGGRIENVDGYRTRIVNHGTIVNRGTIEHTGMGHDPWEANEFVNAASGVIENSGVIRFYEYGAFYDVAYTRNEGVLNNMASGNSWGYIESQASLENLGTINIHEGTTFWNMGPFHGLPGSLLANHPGGWIENYYDMHFECEAVFQDDGEFWGGSVTYETCEPCGGDLDGSGAVDVSDLMIMIPQWWCHDCTGDLDGNGWVERNDLLILFAQWGPCPGPG